MVRNGQRQQLQTLYTQIESNEELEQLRQRMVASAAGGAIKSAEVAAQLERRVEETEFALVQAKLAHVEEVAELHTRLQEFAFLESSFEARLLRDREVHSHSLAAAKEDARSSTLSVVHLVDDRMRELFASWRVRRRAQTVLLDRWMDRWQLQRSLLCWICWIRSRRALIEETMDAVPLERMQAHTSATTSARAAARLMANHGQESVKGSGMPNLEFHVAALYKALLLQRRELLESQGEVAELHVRLRDASERRAFFSTGNSLDQGPDSPR